MSFQNYDQFQAPHGADETGASGAAPPQQQQPQLGQQIEGPPGQFGQPGLGSPSGGPPQGGESKTTLWYVFILSEGKWHSKNEKKK